MKNCIVQAAEIVDRMRHFGSNVALVSPAGEVIRYAALAEQVQRVAARLSELLEPGSPVTCVIDRPSVPWIITLYTLIWRRYQVRLLSAQTPLTLLQDKIIANHPLPKVPTIELSALFTTPSTSRLIEEKEQQNQKTSALTLIRTSGSSGEPKDVALSFANHWFNALGSHQNLPFGEGDRWLLSLPLYHVSGLSLLFRALVAGGTLVLADSWRLLPKLSVDYVSFVPLQLVRLLQSAEGIQALQRLKAVLLGGAIAPQAVLEKAFHLGIPVRTTYGLTETASQVTTLPATRDFPKWLSAGKLLPYRRLRIIDGEICVAGKVLTSGYWTSRGLEPLPLRDGFFPTGDIGELDSDGFLFVRGRRDTMFQSGGVKIFPEEIEKALFRIPGITGAWVVPVAHPEYGHRPIAFVEWEKTMVSSPSESALREQLREWLDRYKIPDRILLLPAEFRGKMKVPRKALQAYAEQWVKQEGGRLPKT